MLLFWTDSLQINIAKDLRVFKIEGQGVDKEPTGVLAINEDTGEISVKRPVDYEQFKVLKVRRNLLEYCDLLKSSKNVCVFCLFVCVSAYS